MTEASLTKTQLAALQFVRESLGAHPKRLLQAKDFRPTGVLIRELDQLADFGLLKVLIVQRAGLPKQRFYRAPLD